MEDPGVGGGTSSICEITPSDLAGMVDNLVNRVESLEKNLSQLLGANTSAQQLSDLSEQAGWITGVTFMGEEGWTQTPFGTLIPPDGWTGLSSVIDGFQGTLQSSGGGATPTFVAAASPGTDFTGSFYIDWIGGLGTHGDFSYNASNYMVAGTDGDGNDGVEIKVSGVYYFDVFVNVIDGTSAPTTGAWSVQLRKKRLGSGGGVQTKMPGDFRLYDTTNNYGEISIACVRRFNAGDYFLTRVTEWTNGELQVDYAEIVGRFLYPMESTV